MLFLLIFLHAIFPNILAIRKNQFVLDYFNYKNVPEIIVFTCNLVEDDLKLFKDLNNKNIAATLHKLTNVTSIKKLARTKYKKLGVFLDASCYEKSDMQEFFSEASDNYMFYDLYYWLIFGADMNSILQIIEDRSFGVSTDFIISIPDKSNYGYQLFDVYNIFKERGETINITSLGFWNETARLTITLTQEKFPRRANLHKLVIKAIYYKLKWRPPGVSIDDFLGDYRYPIREGLNKFCYILNKHLADLHNFTLVNFEAPAPSSNDSFGAHVRIMSKNLVDISGSPILITQARLNFIKYTHMGWPYRSCFIFRNPQPRKIKVQELLTPLADEVWLLIVAIVLISIAILMTLIRFEKDDNNSVKCTDSILIIVGSFCQQGTIENISRISTRIALLFIMIFALLIYNYYSSSVVSARLNEQIVKINDSLVELGKLNLEIASEWMIVLKLLLSFPDWETKTFYEKYWSPIPPSKWFKEPDIGMKLVQKGGFAYHAVPDTLYPIINEHFSNDEICELTEVHLGRPTMSSFAVRYNSSILEITRVGLTKISEVGLRQRELVRWTMRKPVCRLDILSASSISIYEFASHLILLAIGIVMSAFMCIIEIVNFYYGTSLKLMVKTIQKLLLRQLDLQLMRRMLFEMQSINSVSQCKSI